MPNKTKFASIDRWLAISFGSLFLGLIVAFSVITTYYYTSTFATDERQLQETIADLIGDSLSRVSISGRYHTRLLAEKIARSQPKVAYVCVADRQGVIIAHSNSDYN